MKQVGLCLSIIFLIPSIQRSDMFKDLSIFGTWKSSLACHFLWLHLEDDINFALEDQKPAACKPNVHLRPFHPFSHWENIPVLSKKSLLWLLKHQSFGSSDSTQDVIWIKYVLRNFYVYELNSVQSFLVIYRL